MKVTGNPTPEELAALLVLLSARGGAEEEPNAAASSPWRDRASLLRRPLPHGPGAWRAAR